MPQLFGSAIGAFIVNGALMVLPARQDATSLVFDDEGQTMEKKQRICAKY